MIGLKARWIMYRLKKRGISMTCLDHQCGYSVKTMTTGRAFMHGRLHHWATDHLVMIESKEFFAHRRIAHGSRPLPLRA